MCSQKLHWSVFNFGFPLWSNRKPKHKIEEPICWPPLPGIDPQTVAYILTWQKKKPSAITRLNTKRNKPPLPVLILAVIYCPSRNRWHSEYASYVKLSAVSSWLSMHVCLNWVNLCIYSIHIRINDVFLKCFSLSILFLICHTVIFSLITVLLCCFEHFLAIVLIWSISRPWYPQSYQNKAAQCTNPVRTVCG